MSDNIENLQGQVLIAMPLQVGGVFKESVVYICEHNHEGAMGLIINRQLPFPLFELIAKLNKEDPEKFPEEVIGDNDSNFNHDSVFYGGPCQSDRGFILHDGGLLWDASIIIDDQVCLTSSKDILDDIFADKGPENYLVALGYAGWSSGQLEMELSNNSWLTVEKPSSLLFSTPISERWKSAADALGVDINLLVSDAGLA